MAKEPEQGLVLHSAPERKVDTRPRVNGVLLHRMEHLRGKMEEQLLRDQREMSLSRFTFLDDQELASVRVAGKPLTQRQKRVARAMEMSKKEAPIALQFAHDRLINAQRAQQESKSLSINVERAVIRVPDTRQDALEDAIVIDVEAGNATR